MEKQQKRNPYIQHIYQELAKTFDKQLLKEKLEKNNSIPAFDDQLLVKAHRALPKMENRKDIIESPTKKNRDQCYYYKKMLAYEKSAQKNSEMKESKFQIKQKNQKHILSLREKSEHQNIRKALQKKSNSVLRNKKKLLEMYEQKNTHNNCTIRNQNPQKKINHTRCDNRYSTMETKPLMSRQSSKKSYFENQIKSIEKYYQSMTLRQAEMNSSEQYLNGALPMNTMVVRNNKFPNILKTENKSNIEQSAMKSTDQPINAYHQSNYAEAAQGKADLSQKNEEEGLCHNFINKSDRLSPQKFLKTHGNQELQASDKIEKTQDSPSCPPKKRIRYTRKFNWKNEPLPSTLSRITKQEFQIVIKGYLNLGPILQIPFGFFKAYIGPGNNNSVIKKALKDRGFWTFVDSIEDSPNFVWTQIIADRYNNINNNQKEQTLPSFLSINSQTNIEQFETIVEKQEEHEDEELTYFINSKKNDYIQGYQKLLSKRTFNQYMNTLKSKFKNRYYLQKIKFDVIDSYRKNKSESRTDLGPAMTIKTPIKSSDIILHNHLSEATCLANKKCLLYYLEKYCEIFDEQLDNIIPKSAHISLDQISDDRLNEEFQQKFDIVGKQPWILKPGEFTNRGQGITIHLNKQSLLAELNKIKNQKKTHKCGTKYTAILQKYIEPLLYNGRKFDLRVWVLWNGGQLWWYQEGYARTSCKQFTYKNTNKFVHLTNDAIQSQCSDYGKYQPANKLSFLQLQKYLQTNNNFFGFENKILKEMKELAEKAFRIGGIIFNNNKRTKQNSQNYYDFELFGLDFLLDQNLKPWLIECNSNPCLQINCSLLSRLIPNLIENMLSLTLDCYFPPTLKKKPKDTIQWNQQSFKFQLLYDSLEDTYIQSKFFQEKVRANKLNLKYHYEVEDEKSVYMEEEIITQNKQIDKF